MFKTVISQILLFSLFAYAGNDPGGKNTQASHGLAGNHQAAGERVEHTPRYVLAILSRDSYDGEDEESDGEEDALFDNAFLAQSENLYTQGSFDSGPYSLYDCAAKLEEVNAGPQVSQRVCNLAIRLAEQAFGRAVAESILSAQARMKVVVLCNRIKSVSRSRRYAPNPMPAAAVQVPTAAYSNIEVAELHYHLVPTWRGRVAGNVHAVTELETVARFFRALKRYEQDQGKNINAQGSAARGFRKHFEDSIRKIVPFHSLRNAVKNHQLTVQSVLQFYTADGANPVYLTFFDDDFESIRTQGLGLFSCYDDFVRAQGLAALPSIMSTGYRFASRQDIAMVASEIDRLVRIATASVIAEAPCYPEPNFLILAHMPLTPARPKIVEADFDAKQDAKTKTETRSFIKEAYRKGDALAQTTCFLHGVPLHTETPVRAEGSQGLSSAFDASGRIVNWGEPEMKYLRDMAQSHLMPRDWAQGVVSALALNNEIHPAWFRLQDNVVRFKSTTGKTTYNLAISAVVRMFSAYHPIAPALTARMQKVARVKDRFQIAMLNHLLAYEQTVPAMQQADKVSRGNANYYLYLQAIQRTMEIVALRQMLAGIFVQGNQAALRVEEAARRAGLAIRDGILHYFAFPTGPQLSRTRHLSALYRHEHANYQYSEQDIRRLLRVELGLEPDPLDLNEVSRVGQNKFLFPPIGAQAQQSALEVLGIRLEQHLEVNQMDQTIAVPLHLGAHWVALVIEVTTVNARRNIVLSYVDSIEPDEVTVQDMRSAMEPVLNIYFPDANISAHASMERTQTDLTACGALTVENLLDRLKDFRTPAQPIMTPELTQRLRQAHVSALEARNLALDMDGPAILLAHSPALVSSP